MPVEVVGGRNRKPGHAGEAFGRRNVPDLHDAGRVIKRKRAEENRVYDRKDCRIGPDAQGEHDNGRGGEARVTAEQA